jgi:E3 ubiquitin-protein ligase HUWE1
VSPAAPAEQLLGSFIERHRVTINAILRLSPQLLDRSFSPCIRHSHAIDFDNKKAFFRGVIRKRSSDAHAGSIRITVRRDRVFEYSYHQLRALSAHQMKGRLHVQFSGEEGVDAGGVTREWYVILVRQIFDPYYVPVCHPAAKAARYQPNKSSYNNQEHLDNFRFVGRIFSKAIYDGQLPDAYFTRAFYAHILGVRPTYHNTEAQDPDYNRSLFWMLQNDITEVTDETFSTVYAEFGQERTIDLK